MIVTAPAFPFPSLWILIVTAAGSHFTGSRLPWIDYVKKG